MSPETMTLVAAVTAQGDTIDGFGTDPLWLVLLKAVFIFAFLTVVTLLTIWGERRVVARMQMRVGPNRVGPFGLLQGLADGIKLALKEDILPTAAEKVIYLLAPIISVTAAFMAFAVIPFGPEVSIFGTTTNLQLTDLPVAVLYVLAVASVGIYGIVLAGWSSGSTYPLLGAMRSTAQMISYEVAMALSFVAVFLYAGSMSTSEIVAEQESLWYVIALPVSFAVYAVAMVGETNRAPFDLPEAEGELVAGFATEYSSMKYAMFFLAEYVNMITVSGLLTTLYLGGWRAPWPLSIWDGANENWWPMLWFVAKVVGVLFVFIWLRGTLPRLRYDQFMRLGWKRLIPVSVVWIVLVAAVRAISNEGADQEDILLWVGGPVAVILALSIVYDLVAPRPEEREPEPSAVPAEFDPMAGGYPVPPLPGQTLPATPRPPVAEPATAPSGPGRPSTRPDQEDSGA